MEVICCIHMVLRNLEVQRYRIVSLLSSDLPAFTCQNLEKCCNNNKVNNSKHINSGFRPRLLNKFSTTFYQKWDFWDLLNATVPVKGHDLTTWELGRQNVLRHSDIVYSTWWAAHVIFPGRKLVHPIYQTMQPYSFQDVVEIKSLPLPFVRHILFMIKHISGSKCGALWGDEWDKAVEGE